MHDPPPQPDDARTQLTLLWTSAQPMVMAFISSMVPNHADAEDVLQRTAYDIATNFEQYDPGRPFVAWAIGIAKFKVLDYRRDSSRSRIVFNDDALEQIASAYASDSEVLGEQSRLLRSCMGKLSHKGRSLIELRYSQDLKPAEIARQIGTSPNTVSNALSRVREKLRDCVKRRQQSGGAR